MVHVAKSEGVEESRSRGVEQLRIRAVGESRRRGSRRVQVARHRRGEMSRHPSIDHGNCRIEASESGRQRQSISRKVKVSMRRFLGVSRYSCKRIPRVEDSTGKNQGVEETNTRVVEMSNGLQVDEESRYRRVEVLSSRGVSLLENRRIEVSGYLRVVVSRGPRINVLDAVDLTSCGIGSRSVEIYDRYI